MSEHIDRFTLEAYVEQALPAAERRAVEAHVTACPPCQARLAAAKQIPALLYQLPREQPAPDLITRINVAIATQRAPATARWMQILVPAMFVVGLVLLVLAAPKWSGWAGVVATAQPPTEDAILAWLGNLVADPTMTMDIVTTFAEQALTSAAEDMDVLFTLATVLLAAASLAGLVQLLGSERPLDPTAEARA